MSHSSQGLPHNSVFLLLCGVGKFEHETMVLQPRSKPTLKTEQPQTFENHSEGNQDSEAERNDELSPRSDGVQSCICSQTPWVCETQTWGAQYLLTEYLDLCDTGLGSLLIRCMALNPMCAQLGQPGRTSILSILQRIQNHLYYEQKVAVKCQELFSVES